MRKLTANEVEARVSMVTDKGCQLLLYKTARVDRAILDEEFGAMNWQTDFKVVNDNLYCGIGVYDEKKSQWIWKWDCGTESNTEKEKGEASDSFKRAGFKWGIGVELYNTPFIWVKVPVVSDKAGKYYLKDKFQKFEVSKIESDNGAVTLLEIVDAKTKEVLYSFGFGKKPLPQQPQLTPAQKSQQTRAENKANFEERFAKAYQLFKSPTLKYSYALEESFKSLMAEAEKRKYDDEKQEEMWEIFNSLQKDSLPQFSSTEYLNAG